MSTIWFHLGLAWRSIRRAPGFAVTTIATLAVGLAAWFLSSSASAALYANPVAGRPIYDVAITRDVALPGWDRPTGSMLVSTVPRVLLTDADLAALLGSGIPVREAATFAGAALVAGGALDAAEQRVRFCAADLFEMFRIPLAAGRPFATAGEVVVSEGFATAAFGDAERAIGQTIELDRRPVQITGVVSARYRTHFHLYDFFTMARPEEAVHAPYELAAQLAVQPELSWSAGRASDPGYAMLWVELPDAAAVDAFAAHARRGLGRAEPDAIVLRDPVRWRAEVMQLHGPITIWPIISALTLVACVLNIMRLLVAKFATRTRELGVLRAFGARRRSLVGHLLLEAVLLGAGAGLIGGVLGLVLTPLAAGSVIGLGEHLSVGARELGITVALAVGLALVAAVVPAIRIAIGAPARHLGRR